MEKLKLVILSGIPCSGKSTWAKQFVKGKTDWVIVNRDSFRLGRGDYWIPSQESYITKLEDTAIESALNAGLNVISDNTNLNPKTISKLKEIAEIYGAEVEEKFFHVSLKEAISRDLERGQKGGISVGKKVIEDFYYKYIKDKKDSMYVDRPYLDILDNPNLPFCIICDIDGTIANMQGRSPYDYSKVLSDKPDTHVIIVVETLVSNIDNCQLIFVSGRPDSCRESTLVWLDKLINVDYSLYMRKTGDSRKDSIIKEEIYNEYVKDNYNVLAVFDDRNQTVAKWRELGLLTFQVAGGNF